MLILKPSLLTPIPFPHLLFSSFPVQNARTFAHLCRSGGEKARLAERHQHLDELVAAAGGAMRHRQAEEAALAGELAAVRAERSDRDARERALEAAVRAAKDKKRAYRAVVAAQEDEIGRLRQEIGALEAPSRASGPPHEKPPSSTARALGDRTNKAGTSRASTTDKSKPDYR
jgi:hypothetical protein